MVLRSALCYPIFVSRTKFSLHLIFVKLEASLKSCCWQFCSLVISEMELSQLDE